MKSSRRKSQGAQLAGAYSSGNEIGQSCKQNSPLLQRKFPTIANKLLKALDPNNIFPIADFIGRLATSSATDISSDSAIRSGVSKEGFIAALMSMRDS